MPKAEHDKEKAHQDALELKEMRMAGGFRPREWLRRNPRFVRYAKAYILLNAAAVAFCVYNNVMGELALLWILIGIPALLGLTRLWWYGATL